MERSKQIGISGRRQWISIASLLLPGLGSTLLTGCSSEVSPPFFNYQQCKKEITAEYQKKGSPQLKAELDARDYCKKLFP